MQIREFLDLNDDCLCYIFNLLSLREQLIVADVCDRFRDIVISMWSLKYQKLFTGLTKLSTDPLLKDVSNVACTTLTIEEYKKFFSMNAKSLKCLYIESTTNQAFTSYLGRNTIRPDFVFYFHFTYDRLRELICFDGGLHNGHLRMIQKRCPNLEVLRICGRHVTDEFIVKMKKLHTLEISNGQLSKADLVSLNANLTNLRTLQIAGSFLKDSEDQPEWSPNLLELHISISTFIAQILHSVCRFRFLRYLNIIFDNPENTSSESSVTKTNAWNRFFSSYNPKIVSLKLVCLPNSLHDFQRLLKKCLFVRQLHIVVNDFQDIRDLNELLKQQKSIRKLSLHILQNFNGILEFLFTFALLEFDFVHIEIVASNTDSLTTWITRLFHMANNNAEDFDRIRKLQINIIIDGVFHGTVLNSLKTPRLQKENLKVDFTLNTVISFLAKTNAIQFGFDE